jgi:hypothetical protein
MAGENSLPTQYYHDDQQIICEAFTTPGATNIPILCADRTLIIDQIVVATLTGTSTNTLDFRKTSQALPTDGVVVPAALNATATTILAGTTGTVPAGTAEANNVYVVTTESGVGTLGVTTKLDVDKNTLDAGNWLFLRASAAMTNATVFVQVRFRSRPK